MQQNVSDKYYSVLMFHSPINKNSCITQLGERWTSFHVQLQREREREANCSRKNIYSATSETLCLCVCLSLFLSACKVSFILSLVFFSFVPFNCNIPLPLCVFSVRVSSCIWKQVARNTLSLRRHLLRAVFVTKSGETNVHANSSTLWFAWKVITCRRLQFALSLFHYWVISMMRHLLNSWLFNEGDHSSTAFSLSPPLFARENNRAK